MDGKDCLYLFIFIEIGYVPQKCSWIWTKCWIYFGVIDAFSIHFPWMFGLLVGKLGKKREPKTYTRTYDVSRLYMYYKIQILRDTFISPQK